MACLTNTSHVGEAVGAIKPCTIAASSGKDAPTVETPRKILTPRRRGCASRCETGPSEVRRFPK